MVDMFSGFALPKVLVSLNYLFGSGGVRQSQFFKNWGSRYYFDLDDLWKEFFLFFLESY